MDTAKKELIVRIEVFKNILVERATGQEVSDEEYIRLRQELLSNPLTKGNAPLFIIHCRNLGEFWNFIKAKFSTYAERREFIRVEFDPLLSLLEFGDTSPTNIKGDLFRYQFPAGLPFGLRKPDAAFVPEQGGQRVLFEETENTAVIRESVYPNFTYQDLERTLHGQPISRKELPAVLAEMCQTESERKLFITYAKRFQMRTEYIPVLVPQAWIQWHSQPKKDLRSSVSSYVDNLYRVDFVAFWEQQRFAILVDDISHYAHKVGQRWDASQEAYSKRLKEDRKLRKERWQVFRMSNWEIRTEQFIDDILADLRSFIGF